MQQRFLGTGGLKCGAIGYGAMGLAGVYGPTDEASAIRTIQHALDVGSNHIDTANAYGNGSNEILVGKAIAGRRKDAVIATKFGIVTEPDQPATDWKTGWGFTLRLNGTPAYVKRSIDQSLKRLGVDVIDLWYMHFPDPATPVTETFGAMADAVKAGKVKHLGLSNVSAKQIRAAHKVHPIAAIQYEYSLVRREIEQLLLPTLRELRIGLVPWAPLGAGFLTGTVTQIAEGDFRNNIPKLAGDNLAKNQERFGPLLAVAKELKITPAQMALAWLMHQGDDIVPIPGTRKPERIDENLAALNVKLDAATLKCIGELAPVGLAGSNNLVA